MYEDEVTHHGFHQSPFYQLPTGKIRYQDLSTNPNSKSDFGFSLKHFPTNLRFHLINV